MVTKDSGMELNGFKSRFWWDFWGKICGAFSTVVYPLPLLYFLRKGYILPSMKKNLLIILAAGLGVGGHGVYLSKTGLKENCYSINEGDKATPKAWLSPYRMVSHTGMCYGMFAALLWNSLTLLKKP